MNKKLVKFIDEAVASSKSSIEALDKIIKWKKENDGLIGIHFSFFPTSENGVVDKENDAEILIKMLRGSANGEYKDVTNLPL